MSPQRGPLWADIEMSRRAWAMGKALEHLSGSEHASMPNVILVARTALDVVEQGFPAEGVPFALSSLDPAPEPVDEPAGSFAAEATKRRSGRS